MTTKQLRQKILDLAIHGKLVKQDANDEPASTLLARIRAEKEQLVKNGKLKKKDLVTTPVSDEDKPFEVPKGWEWVSLKTIAFVGTGSTPSRNNKEYYGGNIPWISSSATSLDKITEPSDYITDKALKETNCQLYPIGTIIMAMYGEGKTRGQISELAIESCTNQACAAVLPYDKELKKYIKLYLQSQYFHLRTLAEGGNQPNLNLGKISSYIIPLPPLAEQQRIVAAVEQWMSLIDIIESGQENLQQSIALAKNKILDLAIKGKLVEKEGEWEEKTLGEVCTFESGLAYSSDKYVSQGSPLIRISNIVDGSVSLTNCAHINESDYPRHFYVDKGDLLIAMSGATTGKMGIYHCENRAVLNQRVGNIKIKDHTKLCVGFRNLIMEGLKPTIEEIAYGGAQPNISSKMICALPIPLPPLSEQHRIVSKIEELFTQLDIIANALK